MGANNMPYGGFNEDELQQFSWAPLRDSPNDWIQIGKMDGMICKTYMSLNLNSPTWGISGEGNEEITRYIMCCANQGGAVDDETIMDGTTMAEEATPPAPDVTTTLATQMDEIATEIFNPVWYDRFSGWDGQTYDEAVSFCISKDPKQELCPFQA